MHGMEEVRLWFTEVLWAEADWRKEKAAEYPEDERNGRAAEGITELGKWFTLLPAFDPLVERLMEVLVRLYDDPDSAAQMAPSIEDIVSRFRFDDPDEKFNRFLDRLAADIEAALPPSGSSDCPPSGDPMHNDEGMQVEQDRPMQIRVPNVTYTAVAVSTWNRSRAGVHQLDSVILACLRDPETTDRDRIAIALRELRRLGYQAEAEPIDWTGKQVICALDDSRWMAFGRPAPSRLNRRLRRIVQRAGADDPEFDAECFIEQLYPETRPVDVLYDGDDYAYLVEPYRFDFKGSPVVVESVFQAVGFTTRLGVYFPDDGSGSQHYIDLALPHLMAHPDEAAG